MTRSGESVFHEAFHRARPFEAPTEDVVDFGIRVDEFANEVGGVCIVECERFQYVRDSSSLQAAVELDREFKEVFVFSVELGFRYTESFLVSGTFRVVGKRSQLLEVSLVFGEEFGREVHVGIVEQDVGAFWIQRGSKLFLGRWYLVRCRRTWH